MTVDATELDLPELDLFGLEREDAAAAIDAARRQHWLARSPIGFAVLRHADVTATLRDPRWHSALAVMPEMAGIDDPEFLDRRQRSILAMEGEEHTRVRRLVSGAFTPKAADRLRPVMRDVIGGLVDEVAPRGRCDLVADVCEPYPIPIICELLGAPKEDWKLFSLWATDIFRVFNNNLQEDLPVIKRAQAELDDYVRAMVAARRSSPADDLLSDLIAAEEAGDRLTTDELVMLAEAVLMAGTDTTRNQLACSVALFASHPDQWAALAEDPSLAPRAVEESMRVLGTIRGTGRVAAADIEYRDVRFRAGTFMSLSFIGANTDDTVWEDPATFDITAARSATQLTFGWGTHFCLGANLARAELQEALPLLARRMPNLALAGEISWKPTATGIWGPERLPLRFDPEQPPGPA